MNRVKIVMLETLKNHLKSATFWVMIILPVLFGVIGGLGGHFAANSSTTSEIGIVASSELAPYFETNSFKLVNEEELDKLIADDEISSYAKIREDDGQVLADFNTADASLPTIIGFEETLRNIQKTINQQKANLDADQEAILAKEPVINHIQDEKSDSKMLGQVVYFVLIFLMYMVLMSFVNLVLAEVATEKGTKMIEFIFSSVKPGDYFAGKMLGNFIAVFVQIFTYLIVGIIAYFIAKSKGLLDNINLNFTMTGQTYGIIAEIVLLFILGIFIYLVIASMLGSFASKVEDAGKMGTPLIFGTVILFFLAMILQNSGDILATKILSYVPLASTFFMPLRLLNDYASLTEGLISIAILLVTIFLVYRFGEKVYKRNILNYSTEGFFKRKK